MWLHEDPAFDFVAEFIGLGADVLCMAKEPEGLTAGSKGGPPIDVEYKAVARCGRTAVRCAAAGVDQGGQVGVDKEEARYVPRSPDAGQVFEDVGIRIGIESSDYGNISDGTEADLCSRQFANAEGWIPFSVDTFVVEAVRNAIFQEVDKKETVAILPLRCLLHGEDRGVFRGTGKRVCEFAVLKLE